MDFLTLFRYIVAVVETVSLVAALCYAARSMHEKKIKRTRQGKKGGKNTEITEKLVAAYYRNACIFFFIYLILNFFRRYSGFFG